MKDKNLDEIARIKPCGAVPKDMLEDYAAILVMSYQDGTQRENDRKDFESDWAGSGWGSNYPEIEERVNAHLEGCQECQEYMVQELVPRITILEIMRIRTGDNKEI